MHYLYYKYSEDKKFNIIKSQLLLLKILAQGHTLLKSAEILGIKYYNLQKRTQNLYKKFNVTNRLQLIQKAIELKIITTKEVSTRFRKRFLKISNNVEYQTKIQYDLTNLEINYLHLFANGLTEKEIRDVLKLKGKYHSLCIRKTIIWKLNVDNMMQALVKYIKYVNI